MWREAHLAFDDSVAALNCSIVPAHPWVYGLGQQTENGAYLSPVNAISYLAEKLAGTGGNADVVIMMVAGQTHDSFMSSLNQLVDVFPAPAFTQVKRLALSAAELAMEKMQIPAKYSAGLADALPLSVPTNRAALAAAAIKKAQEEAAAVVDIGALQKQLDDFARLRDGLLNDIANGLTELQGKSARAWVFTASGDLSTTLLDLVKGIPLQSAIYTAAMMLTGDNLDGIKGMIHDLEPDAGA
ncbi:hypothetical protein I5398_17450 [Citrobacter freundii]|uniref:hypothetical protein n=1 Tax=Citrobacter koseri TaxID=545 RepID=UPI001906E55F|nr:hypothetical protein [Citrobacter koseri]MBJ8797825.1 hypothetical protein [Citrobacter freundii]MBJ8937639.1 hypothetical protein [Citrobacter koseri]HAT7566275.1 hypothetical protein [Citrobacter koseri]HEM8001472.1 hypothetical protein [Citrobacter koseri]